jgi:hypothetical protein
MIFYVVIKFYNIYSKKYPSRMLVRYNVWDECTKFKSSRHGLTMIFNRKNETRTTKQEIRKTKLETRNTKQETRN